ncbi:MAG: diaminopimelate decarboxylase [Eubacteriales bacterium]|nr:diaminopimelate decarboxylase [Eubacteriales bacterium]
MRTRDTLFVQDGRLKIGGCDAGELARRYGTPLYVMDEAYIRRMCRSFTEAFKQESLAGGVIFASKAFSCLAMYHIVAGEGLGADLGSGGELYTAHKAGFPMEKVFFHGSNKTPAELRMALDFGVGHIVVDSLSELQLLCAICAEMNKRAHILLRMNPGIEAETHAYIRTASTDSKFGMAFDGEGMEALRLAIREESVVLDGLHCHIGSQIFDMEAFLRATEIMSDMFVRVRETFGLSLGILDLGGGFGIRYVDGDCPTEPSECVRVIGAHLRKVFAARGLSTPALILEPGRSIVGEAGVTLYTVGVVKDIPGVRRYVSIDGGMGDNPRYALYKARYETVVVDRADEKPAGPITLAGKCCESGDLIGVDMPLQEARRGDVVAVFSTGAYNYSMASNYNRNPRPAVVLVRGGESAVMVERESFDDLCARDRIPEWLK